MIELSNPAYQFAEFELEPRKRHLLNAGQPIADVCRQMGISEATYYVWKKRYANMGILEVRELRQLRDENARLKRLVADLTLDRHVLQEVIKKKI